jgi:PAS domain-containing protein
MGLPSDRAQSDRVFSAIVLMCAALTGAAGLWVVGRWQLGLPPLVEAHRDPPMQPLTALCLVLWSISLFAAEQRMRLLANLSALVLIGMVGFRLYEAVAGVDHGVDRLLFPNAFAGGADHLRVRGGMAEATAINFLCLSVAVLGRPYVPRLAAGALIVPTLLASFALLAMMLGVNSPAGFMGYANMALATSLGALIAVTGALCLDPQPQWVRRLREGGNSARLTRLLLLSMVVLPAGLAWDVLQGSRAGVYTLGFGLALITTTTGALFAFVVLWFHRLMEAQNAKLREKEAVIRALSEYSTDPQFFHDARREGFPLLMLNPVAQAMLGGGSSVGLTPYDVAPQAAEMGVARLEQCVQTRQVLRIVDTEASAYGLVWEFVYVPIIGTDGEVDQVLVTLRDITRLKKARQRKLAALEAAGALMTSGAGTAAS